MDTDGKVKGIVLPSGSFARIERATYRDWIEALGCEPALLSVAFAAKVVTIDGRKITTENILDMELEDGMAVVGLANSLIQKGLTTIKGIA